MLRIASIVAAVGVTAGAVSAAAAPVRPVGSVLFMEGEVQVNGHPVKRGSGPLLEQGQRLQTGDGRVEVALTPESVLRLDHGTTVRFVRESLADTEVQVEQGTVIVESRAMPKGTVLQVDDGAGTVVIRKPGTYRLAAADAAVDVLHGSALVTEQGRTVEVGSHHEMSLAGEATLTKAPKFADEFARWSDLREQYTAQAAQGPRMIYGGPGWREPWGYGPGYGYYARPVIVAPLRLRR